MGGPRDTGAAHRRESCGHRADGTEAWNGTGGAGKISQNAPNRRWAGAVAVREKNEARRTRAFSRGNGGDHRGIIFLRGERTAAGRKCAGESEIAGRTSRAS